MYDICIIGAGVIGANIARELAKYKVKVCLVEKEEDVSCGASKANSGIVHGGYSDKPGTLKAELCVKGNRMYEQLNKRVELWIMGDWVIGVGFSVMRTSSHITKTI